MVKTRKTKIRFQSKPPPPGSRKCHPRIKSINGKCLPRSILGQLRVVEVLVLPVMEMDCKVMEMDGLPVMEMDGLPVMDCKVMDGQPVMDMQMNGKVMKGN